MASKLTELSCVNIIISNIGQAPVTSLDSVNPMVQLAKNIISEISNSVQSEGWSFNREYGFPFLPNSDDEIIVPPNVIAWDLSRYADQDVVLRSGKMYDKRNHTYQFNESLQADITWLFDYDDLPEPFKQYIAIRAANLFAARSVGTVEVMKYSEREEMQARAAMMEYETQAGDANMLGTEDGRLVSRGYHPANAIYRY